MSQANTMSETKSASLQGKFCWYEWMGDNVKAAADFYAHVVGWTAKESDMAGGRPYTVVSAGDTGVGGMMAIPAEAKAMGARSGWNGYVWVEDVDKAAAKVTAAGGSVKRPPTDIPGVGRFAVAADPHGAGFLLFRNSGGNPPAPPAPETPGLVGWRELHAGDGAAAFTFYSGLFGWTKRQGMEMGAAGVYQLFGFSGGESDYGGIMTRMPEMPAPMWLYYFNVPAIDAAAERVKANGGKIINGPMEVPGGQWIVHGLDLEGAMFALVAPKR
jgi:predicted enzyme related to lactoylglutathione lyase